MTSYRLMDGVAGRPGVGSSGTQPPSSSTSYSGTIVVSTAFQVTQGAMYMQGYWWWRADTAQSGAAQSFALWQVTGTTLAAAGGLFVTGSQVTSGSLSVGWNYVPLPTPLALTPNTPYRVQTGFSNNFPQTTNEYGSGNLYSAGIVNGPLSAYSDSSGSAYFPAWVGASAGAQSGYTTTSADPTAVYGGGGNSSFISWVDVQVTDQVPAGASYRIWPNYPVGGPLRTDDANGYTIGTEFSLSQPCALNAIWWYSPSGATDLPSWCGIWDVSGQTVVAGTGNNSPSWSGAAGAGWISVPYNGTVILAANKAYKTSVFHAALSNHWFSDVGDYWHTTGGAGYPGANGITNGPLTAPSDPASTAGQSSEHLTTFAYPGTSDGGANDWTDVQVTPVGTTTAVAYTMRMFP